MKPTTFDAVRDLSVVQCDCGRLNTVQNLPPTTGFGSFVSAVATRWNIDPIVFDGYLWRSLRFYR